MASHVHDLSERTGHSFVLDVRFHEELSNYSEKYLADRITDVLPVNQALEHSDGRADILLRPVAWDLIRYVLAADYVYVGSSRMMEIISGHHEHAAAHSLRVRCRRAPDRPSYADAIYHASLVNWASHSDASRKAKARHFKKKIADAEGQLPDDRPGTIHVGMQSIGHNAVDQYRHLSNAIAAREFENQGSRLRWVYGNYFLIEVTTRENESCAMEESMAPYRIGRHKTGEPLPGHLLVADDQLGVSGLHWDGKTRS